MTILNILINIIFDALIMTAAFMACSVCVILIAGYIFYKVDDGAKTWDAGIRSIITISADSYKFLCCSVAHFIQWAYPKFTHLLYWVTETEPPEKAVNPILALSNPEALELADRFRNHPFETPFLSENKVSDKGTFYCEIEALGLAEKYKNLDNTQIAKMAQHTIQNYYMETRFIRVMAHIDMASPIRLCFSVPLSEEGRKRLENRGKPHSTDSTGADSAPPLDETIPELPEIREGHGLDEEINLEGDTEELP